jgi:hypothetical protein
MAAVTALALAIAPTAKAQINLCSNATLHGTFAYTGTGIITAPPDGRRPVANVGTQYFDGNGGTTGAATLSGNGTSSTSDHNGHIYPEF